MIAVHKGAHRPPRLSRPRSNDDKVLGQVKCIDRTQAGHRARPRDPSRAYAFLQGLEGTMAMQHVDAGPFRRESARAPKVFPPRTHSRTRRGESPHAAAQVSAGASEIRHGACVYERYVCVRLQARRVHGNVPMHTHGWKQITRRRPARARAASSNAPAPPRRRTRAHRCRAPAAPPRPRCGCAQPHRSSD